MPKLDEKIIQESDSLYLIKTWKIKKIKNSTTIINSLHEYMNPEILSSIIDSVHVCHTLNMKYIKSVPLQEYKACKWYVLLYYFKKNELIFAFTISFY